VKARTVGGNSPAIDCVRCEGSAVQEAERAAIRVPANLPIPASDATRTPSAPEWRPDAMTQQNHRPMFVVLTALGLALGAAPASAELRSADTGVRACFLKVARGGTPRPAGVYKRELDRAKEAKALREQQAAPMNGSSGEERPCTATEGSQRGLRDVLFPQTGQTAV
jgi:hypothetical protein